MSPKSEGPTDRIRTTTSFASISPNFKRVEIFLYGFIISDKPFFHMLLCCYMKKGERGESLEKSRVAGETLRNLVPYMKTDPVYV